MITTYIVLAAILVVYTLRRRLDFLSFGALSFIVYHIHAIYGDVFIHSRERRDYYLYEDYLSDEVYYLLFMQMALLLVFMIIYDSKNKPRRSKRDSRVNQKRSASQGTYLYSFRVYGYLCVLAYFAEILRIGVGLLIGDKSDVWESIGLIYVFAIWGAIASFAYGVKNKKLDLILICASPVVIHLFIGSRAYFASLIVIVVLLLSSRNSFRIASNVKYFAITLFLAASVHIYKIIWLDIKAFDFKGISDKLSDPETYLWALRMGEPRIVLANYNYIVDSAFRLDGSDILLRFLSLIPFGNRFAESTHGIRLSGTLQEQLDAKYGLASNFWAEGYAMFGYFGVFLFFIIWLACLAKANQYITSTTWKSYFIISIAAYLCFYIHRLDFVKAIGNVKFLFFAAILWYLIDRYLISRSKKV